MKMIMNTTTEQVHVHEPHYKFSFVANASISGVKVFNYYRFPFSNGNNLWACPIDSATPRHQPYPHEKILIWPCSASQLHVYPVMKDQTEECGHLACLWIISCDRKQTKRQVINSFFFLYWKANATNLRFTASMAVNWLSVCQQFLQKLWVRALFIS